eukprot:CAMPEP_0118657418 /NCGR_PEP_ID=MMETSP0785-20121206/14007_1 /TAXON_ID=91992 /ORGANISM="Bolidomonas pacifica, Strain CCMP 1866" /LENGTH=104 /DNA_ID=CAMNT_0006550333 /DNA_START=237 /DNA_END=551 /DNA_ORIENTATION=+
MRSSMAPMAVRSSFFKNCISIRLILTISPVMMFCIVLVVTPSSNYDSIKLASIPSLLLTLSSMLMFGYVSSCQVWSILLSAFLVSSNAALSVILSLTLLVKNSV